MTHRWWLSPVVAAFLFAGTCPGPSPSNIKVFSVFQAGGDWFEVKPDHDGRYPFLPSRLTSGGFRISFNAPHAGNLRVTLDETLLQRFEDIVPPADPDVSGYYRVQTVVPGATAGSLSTWTIAIRPANRDLGKRRHTIGVSHRPTKGPASLQRTVEAVAGPELIVMNAGNGSGQVLSNPPGIDCGLFCNASFSPGTLVTLTMNPAAGSTTQWSSGSCVSQPAQNQCVVVFPGDRNIIATSNFIKSTSGGVATGCPAAKPFGAFRYLGTPACTSNDIAGHPSALLACDSAGYFCCELDGAQSNPRCGTGRRIFPADCMDYGPNARLEPGGCYEQVK